MPETKGYTKLIELLERCGIAFLDSGDSQDNTGDRVSLTIPDETLGSTRLVLHFNVDRYGKETFYKQEIE